MKHVTTYLHFDGNCREAMTFYGDCLGAKLELSPYTDMVCDQIPNPEALKDRIMHARLTKTEPILMASDSLPGMASQTGANFSVCLDCESVDEIERLFTSIGKNGSVTMPLQDTFWGARFGMLTDQFGINWMFHFEHPKQ